MALDERIHPRAREAGARDQREERLLELAARERRLLRSAARSTAAPRRPFARASTSSTARRSNTRRISAWWIARSTSRGGATSARSSSVRATDVTGMPSWTVTSRGARRAGPVHPQPGPRPPLARAAHIDKGEAPAQQGPVARGRAVAEQRPCTAREDRRHEAPLGREQVVPDGEHAGHHPMQPPAPEPIGDRAPRQAERQQLAQPDDAVLRAGERRDLCLDRGCDVRAIDQRQPHARLRTRARVGTDL